MEKVSLKFLYGINVFISNCFLSSEYRINGYDKTNKKLVSQILNKNNQTYIFYPIYVDWHIQILRDNFVIFNYHLNLEKQNVFIDIDPDALGDNIAFIPIVEEFRKKHNCKLFCRAKYYKLFRRPYPEITFVETPPDFLVAAYKLALYSPLFNTKEPWRQMNLQEYPAKLLGLNIKEIQPNIRPNIRIENATKFKRKYVAIATEATLKAKEWNLDGGWQKVVDFLVSQGLMVVNVSLDGLRLNNCLNINDDSPIEETAALIQESEFFIGVSSGLSWLSTAVGRKTILISGITKPWSEFKDDCIRLHNPNVCNGCFHKVQYPFDRNNWNWCPEHEGTERHFECSKKISSEQVVEEIKKLI